MGRRKKELELDFTFIDDFHPSFTSKMITQLTESGSALLGESITNCLWGILIDEDGANLANDGHGLMKVSAVDWSSFSIDVTIKWSASDKKNILPTDNVEEIDITFNWCEDFPVNSIKMQSKKKTVVFYSFTFPFEVEYSGYIESDICLEVGLNTEHEDDKQLVVDTLKSAFENWNLESEKSSGHYMKFMRYIKKYRNKYITYFDLGSIGKEGIHYLINSLAKNDEMKISKIFVKQT
ncbi:hypothetical protein [Bacillus sp. AFS088145]|uniref:hypothetical protein n=1 Tax=Bacillus sp. AFS088145 TaxID=2033514 RepID=UPI000BF4BA93|nr:hypothetical protein [Bacillus sp. AFS088145]PFH88708.1 hypothetical protein COI44_08115 [Bacillus sp. AFS088145]